MKEKISTFLVAFALFFCMLPSSVLAELPEGVPNSISTPTLSNIKLVTDENGEPRFQFEVTVPQEVLTLDEERPTDGYTVIDYYCKIDNGEWEQTDGGHLDSLIESKVNGKDNTFYTYAYPIDEGDLETTDIKAHTYSYKAQIYYVYNYGEGPGEWDNVYSGFSNEITLGSGSFYAKASDWAKTELEKADDLGLIPGILQGADMTKPITREEFCELSVLLYEKVTAKQSQPVIPNPFNDTTNGQILKAFNLGITTGTSEITFSPKVLINREQCAAMLFRAIKAIKPDADYSINGVNDFPDQKSISSWAVDATKYMSKQGIITGDAQGNFMPKATTSAQEAAGFGMATREQAIALAVRTYGKIK